MNVSKMQWKILKAHINLTILSTLCRYLHDKFKDIAASPVKNKKQKRGSFGEIKQDKGSRQVRTFVNKLGIRANELFCLGLAQTYLFNKILILTH